MARKPAERKAHSSRSDRRMLRNRKALLDAAEKLFAEKGLERVTIDEITEAADLAKGTFYTYFNDKNEIAGELARTIRHEIREQVAIAARGVDDPAGLLAVGISVCLRAAAVSPARAAVLARMYSIWLTAEANREFLIVEYLESGYRTGRFPFGDLQLAIVLTVGVVQAGITRALQLAEWDSIKLLTLELAEAVLRGLGIRGSEAHAVATKITDRVFSRNLNATAGQVL
jgi:AcrR family transcriptional regulator